MKLGAENRTKLIAAVSLGVVAIALLGTPYITGFFGGSSPGGTSSAAMPAAPNVADFSNQATHPARRNSAKNRENGKKQSAGQSLDPTLRYDFLRVSEDTKYEGIGRNIFRVFVEPPPRPVAPVVVNQPARNQPQAAPPPPPINLKFYGFATPTGGSKRIFLAQGEDVFIAKEGDIVNRRYKIVRISPNAVEILDVLSNNRQSIPLTQA